MKIVSGGQTGVDRAALDAALEAGVDAGGWCPESRMAEDGAIPDSYPLRVLPGAGYVERTRQNVIDSDATAIIYFGAPTGGTKQTIAFCVAESKPHVTIDGQGRSAEEAAAAIEDFVRRHGIAVLNVAGPRASGEPRAYSYAKQVMRRMLETGGASG